MQPQELQASSENPVQHYSFEEPVGRLLASTLNPNRPHLGQELTAALVAGQPIDNILLPPNNDLVRQTEYLFKVEPSQFASFVQPYVEAVTNEAEAQRADGQRVKVDVYLTPEKITVKGNGKGMDFQRHFIGQVIRPHAGDENKLRGQFGQGTLSYWTAGERIRIISQPENPQLHGFEVELRNNTDHPEARKTVAGRLIPSLQESTSSGTAVIFEEPRFNGKPLNAENLQYIAEYIGQAVENIYYAEITVHLGDKTEVVNKTALTAERFQAGEAEIVLLAGNPDSESSSSPAASYIDVVGETLWSDKFNLAQAGVVLNLPKQVMQAEARSLKQVRLRESDTQSLHTFLKDIKAAIPEAQKRATLLAGIARSIEKLTLSPEASSQLIALIAEQLTECLQETEFPLFVTDQNQNKVVFPSGTLLVPDQLQRRLPEKYHNSALDHVSGFSQAKTMYVAEFRTDSQDEFFVQMGNVFCMNKRLLDVPDVNQNFERGRTVTAALNTELQLYNLVHPAEAEQLTGNFRDLSLGKPEPQNNNVTSPKTTAASLDSMSRDAVREDISALGSAQTQLESQLYPLPPEVNDPPELEQALRERVEWLVAPEHWQQTLKRSLGLQVASVDRSIREILQSAKAANQRRHPSDSPSYPDIDEAMLLQTRDLLLGTAEEQKEIQTSLLQLSEQDISEFLERTSHSIFFEFISFFSKEHPTEADQFSLMLQRLDQQQVYLSWEMQEAKPADWLFRLLISSPWLVAENHLVTEENRSWAAGLQEEDIPGFSAVFREGWEKFVYTKPAELKDLRYGLAAKQTAYSVDGVAARNQILRQGSFLQRAFGRELAFYEKANSKREYSGFFEPDKISEIQNASVTRDQVESMLVDEEFLYKVYELVLESLGNRLEEEGPHYPLDLAIQISSYLQQACELNQKEIWQAHRNCERLGTPSVLRQFIKKSCKTGWGGPEVLLLNERDKNTFSLLSKEIPEKSLQALKNACDALFLPYQDEPYQEEKRKVAITTHLSLLLGVYPDPEQFTEQISIFVRAFQNVKWFLPHSYDPEGPFQLFYMVAAEPEAAQQLTQLLRKHPKLPDFFDQITRTSSARDAGRDERNSYTKHNRFLSRLLLLTETILAKLPPEIDLDDVRVGDPALQNSDSAESKEKFWINIKNFGSQELLNEPHFREVEWRPPEGAQVLSSSVDILEATYLGFKAEGRDVSSISVEEVKERAAYYQATLNPDQLQAYRRRTLSSIQSQDANPDRFYREWFQNSQNAVSDLFSGDRVAVTQTGFTEGLRRFTKVVDFVGMSPEQAIWNLGTIPGLWLTCLNQAGEVRVKTSQGDGRVTYRQFFPQYQQVEGEKDKLVGVSQKTWVVEDLAADQPFTEMTRFEKAGIQSYGDTLHLNREIKDLGTFHHSDELNMYRVVAYYHNLDEELGTDYSLDSLIKLNLHLQWVQNSTKEVPRQVNFNGYEITERNQLRTLARTPNWAVELISTGSDPKRKNLDWVVQGGFPVGVGWPPLLRQVLPEVIFQAFHEEGYAVALRIPHNVPLNKARESINGIEEFVHTSRSEIVGVMTDALAKGLAKQMIDSKMILAFDTNKRFLRNYTLTTDQQLQAAKEIAEGNYSNLEWMLTAADPLSEMTRIALNLPIFKLPDLLPGMSEVEQKPNYSILDLLIIRAGAAYLLKYEMRNNSDPIELLQDLIDQTSTTENLVLSQEAVERMAWLARPSTQALNRLRQASLFTQGTVLNSLVTKLTKSVRIFSLLRARLSSLSRTEAKESTEKPEGKIDVTSDEVRKLLLGESKLKDNLSAAKAVIQTLEAEKNQNVSEMKTPKEKATPKPGEAAYFAAIDLTVQAVKAMYPDVEFTPTQVGFYQEKTTESLARGGHGTISFNVSLDLDKTSVPALLHEALLQESISILVSNKVGVTLAHEAAHDGETGWDSKAEYHGATHDLRFRRDEEQNYRKLCWWFFASEDGHQLNMERIWNEYQSKYIEEQMIDGPTFYDRLSQKIN